MSGCSRSVENRKILKTEGGGDTDDDGTSTSSSDSETETRVARTSSTLASAERHPLQNRVILQNLFKLCPVDVLATSRLVCKQWYEESLISWRNSAPLRFTLENERIFMKHIGDDGARHTLPLQNFLQYVADPKRQCQGKPYRYIRIADSIIDSNIEKKKQFDIFWNALGSNLTTLELKDCRFSDNEEFRRIIFTHCPKLERLIIDRCNFSATRKDSDKELDLLHDKKDPLEQNKHLKVLKIVEHSEEERTLPVTWLELLSRFPLMSSFSDSACSCITSKMSKENFDSLANAIRVIRKRDEKLLPFKVFDVGAIYINPTDPLDKQRLDIFKELRLPLPTVWVNLESDADADSVKDDFGLTRHQLENVLHLLIRGNLWILLKNLAFLKHMPNVESLFVLDVNMSDPGNMAVSNVDTAEPLRLKMKMLKLTELTLVCRIRDGDIPKLHNYMPNVTDLSITLNDKQFGLVCKKWRNLKKLSVFGDKLSDKGVTGMKYRKGPNITNLQNLKDFVFQSNKLTAKSVFLGFLKLPNLRLLMKYGTKPVRWGKRTKQAILDRNIHLAERVSPRTNLDLIVAAL